MHLKGHFISHLSYTTSCMRTHTFLTLHTTGLHACVTYKHAQTGLDTHFHTCSEPLPCTHILGWCCWWWCESWRQRQCSASAPPFHAGPLSCLIQIPLQFLLPLNVQQATHSHLLLLLLQRGSPAPLSSSTLPEEGGH